MSWGDKKLGGRMFCSSVLTLKVHFLPVKLPSSGKTTRELTQTDQNMVILIYQQLSTFISLIDFFIHEYYEYCDHAATYPSGLDTNHVFLEHEHKHAIKTKCKTKAERGKWLKTLLNIKVNSKGGLYTNRD